MGYKPTQTGCKKDRHSSKYMHSTVERKRPSLQTKRTSQRHASEMLVVAGTIIAGASSEFPPA